jgi:exoribonuclease R
LVDRYVGELCVAVCAQVDVPSWIREALPALAGVMEESGHRAHALERACIDLVETVMMASHVGETFEGGIVETTKHGAVVQLRTPPVRARCDGEGLMLGARISVRLVTADPATRTLLFERA